MTVSITDRSGPSVTVVSHASMVNRNDVAPVANSVAEDPMKDCVCECDRAMQSIFERAARLNRRFGKGKTGKTPRSENAKSIWPSLKNSPVACSAERFNPPSGHGIFVLPHFALVALAHHSGVHPYAGSLPRAWPLSVLPSPLLLDMFHLSVSTRSLHVAVPTCRR